MTSSRRNWGRRCLPCTKTLTLRMVKATGRGRRPGQLERRGCTAVLQASTSARALSGRFPVILLVLHFASWTWTWTRDSDFHLASSSIRSHPLLVSMLQVLVPRSTFCPVSLLLDGCCLASSDYLVTFDCVCGVEDSTLRVFAIVGVQTMMYCTLYITVHRKQIVLVST